MPTASSDAPELVSIGSGWLLLDRIEKHPKQSSLAASIGLDAGSFSDFKNNKGAIKISHFKALLDQLGLKLVNRAARCVDEETFRQITKLAGQALQTQPQLLWEENE